VLEAVCHRIAFSRHGSRLPSLEEHLSLNLPSSKVRGLVGRITHQGGCQEVCSSVKTPISGWTARGSLMLPDATQDFQQQNRSFQSVSGYFAFTGPDNFKLIGKDQPLPVTGILVAEGVFQTLGVEPSLGRLFRAEEFLQHAQLVTLLSYAFWRRQLGGDRSIIGHAINLNGAPVTVAGVLPEAFDFGSVFSPGAKVDLFTPYVMDDFRDDGNDLALIGRLKPGVSLAAAQSEADQLFPQLYFEHKHPEYGKVNQASLRD